MAPQSPFRQVTLPHVPSRNIKYLSGRNSSNIAIPPDPHLNALSMASGVEATQWPDPAIHPADIRQKWTAGRKGAERRERAATELTTIWEWRGPARSRYHLHITLKGSPPSPENRQAPLSSLVFYLVSPAHPLSRILSTSNNSNSNSNSKDDLSQVRSPNIFSSRLHF